MRHLKRISLLVRLPGQVIDVRTCLIGIVHHSLNWLSHLSLGARQANTSALTKDATQHTVIPDPVHNGVVTDDALSSDRDTPSRELNEEDSDSGNSGLDLNDPTDVAHQLEAEVRAIRDADLP